MENDRGRMELARVPVSSPRVAIYLALQSLLLSLFVAAHSTPDKKTFSFQAEQISRPAYPRLSEE